MTRRLQILLFVALISLSLPLCACSAGTGGAEAPPATTPAPTYEPPVLTPAPTPEPTPEPYPAGAALTVDGTQLQNATINADGDVYADALALAEVMGARFGFDGDTLRYELRDQVFMWQLAGSPDGEAFLWGGKPMLALEAAARDLSIPLLYDEEYDRYYFTASAARREIPDGRDVNVLMYHAAGDELWGIPELFVSGTTLAEQFEYLNENGYTTITFEDLPYLDEIEKPVMLTFDDGYDDNYTVLFPLIEEYNIKVTIFVITGMIGDTHHMTAGQIEEMSRSELVSIQSHTVSHGFLSDMDAQTLEQEMSQSILDLTRITGKQPFVLCYPTGKYSALSDEYTALYYQYGVRMTGGTWNTSRGTVAVTRHYVARDTSIWSFAAMAG